MKLEEVLTGLETRGKRLEELIELGKVPSGWEGDGGKRLAGLVARRLVPRFIDN